MLIRVLFRLAVVCAVVGTFPIGAIDIDDTRLMSQPAISADHVAFVYAGDLWLVGRHGGRAHRLTSHLGDEASPRFSPDGTIVAFSAAYDGNVDVYTIPVAGGEPSRLTWHPGRDTVQGFTPDGSKVLFTSQRAVFTRRHQHLFTVPLDGGFPTQLPIPHAFKASIAPDGATIAYLPNSEPFRQWKNYRGGTASRIWLYDVATHDVAEVPRPPERSNDTDPMWLGEQVLFLSDRAGEFNLFTLDQARGGVEQLTHHEDFPIVAASAGDGVVIYEQAGYLHVFDPAGGASKRLRIGVGADLRETRPRFTSDPRFARNGGLSPSGARAVLEYRGEIVTLPAKKGDVRNLTQSPGSHDRSPVWSPDGASIAYFSDASGEYALHIAPQDGKGEVRTLPLEGAGFYEDPKWSPDGTKISFSDNGWTLYWIDVAEGTQHKVASEPVYGPVKSQHHSWSPDSQWLAYTQLSGTFLRRVFLYELATGRSHPVTDGLSDVGEPVFDRSGRYLYFAASTDAGPVRTWFAMSNADTESTNALYLAVLQSGERSPLAPESDEEKTAKGEGKEPAASEKAKESGDAPAPVTIDFDGLDQRIIALPVGEGAFSSLHAGGDGKLFYLRGERESAGGPGGPGGGPSLRMFDLEEREESTLLSAADGFSLSADGKKLLVVAGGEWQLADAGKPVDASAGRLDVGAIQVRIEPRAEWRQIFDEAWRINRDYFYDPGMHGADWPAMRTRYAELLPHVASRDDLNRVIRWMCSELAVGHHRVGGGDHPDGPDSIEGGLLGADYAIVDGRYTFAKVFGGLNWNPDLRAPLTEPGVEVEEGWFLLRVDGVDVRAPDNLYRHFEAKAGHIVELEIAADADGADARTVQVVPVVSERALRNRDWVEGNLRRVHEATDGRVAYVYVPDTAQRGHTYFKRYFFPQANKEAIIVDERHNGGGQVADYYIDLLRRPPIAHWATRYGKDLRSPMAAIHGPKVMLIDETAGSGGDLLPWMFHKLGLGPLIGKATWGGLVGILGFPTLMDGGRITAPNIGIWTEDGFVVENVGVPPDIEVEQWPAEVIAGHDPQLERAIAEVLEALEANPVIEPERPPFPIRARP